MRKPSIAQLVMLAIAAAALSFVLLVAFLTPTGSLLSMLRPAATSDGTATNYDEIVRLLDNDEVAQAYWYGGRLSFDGRDGKSYALNEPVGFMLEHAFAELGQHHVNIVLGPPDTRSLSAPTPGQRLAAASFDLITVIMTFGLPIGFIAVLWLAIRFATSATSGSGTWPPVLRRFPTRFAEVAGHSEIKLELEEIKSFLVSPEAFAAVGANAPRGVLMIGPPGTGKTHIAKALAGECGAAFIPVVGSDFSSMFAGQGRNRIKKLFDTARKHAPAIIFIDEIDSIARRRGLDSSSVGNEKDLILNQLLVEMDGFDTDRRVIVVAATNRVDILDPAILRAGRFDRQVQFDLPDLSVREAILRIHTADKPLATGADLRTIARATPGFSGADLANLVNEAAILAARAGQREVTQVHLVAARDKVILGVAKTSMVLSEDDKRTIAVHEAGHALLATLSKHADPVHQATIIPHGRSLGSVVRIPERDPVSTSRAKLLDDLAILMAGRAAEEIVFGPDKATNGAAADFAAATDIALAMVCDWGMSPSGNVLRITRAADGSAPVAARTEAASLLDAAMSRAKNELEAHRAALDALTTALLERETLQGQDIRDLVGAPPSRRRSASRRRRAPVR